MNTNNTNLKDTIHTSILNDIIQNVFSPDQVLNEKSLMKRYNVSRAPVREALIELCSEQVLYSIPYYGYKIKALTARDVSETKAFRCVLECGFMREYWHKFTPENLDKCKEIYHRSIENTQERNAVSHWNDNISFHVTLFEAYENPYALQELHSAMSLQTRAYAQTRWEEWHSHLFRDIPAFHEFILVAIQNNNMETALQMLKADIISI